MFGNVITLQIILRNEIREITACSNTKLQKKSNTSVFSIHYELLHIWNPHIFIIRGIFTALEY